MLAEQFHQAVAAVRTTTQLDHVARQLWAAHGQGAIADEAASAVAGAIQCRRGTLARAATGIALSQAAPARARRRPPRSPDRQRSLERRRRCAMSGAVPARIAASFTMGEVAALAVIARAVQKSGQCLLPLDAIAALAGVSRTTTQNAIRLAERLGLVQRIERRRRGLPSFPNILRIVSAEWLAWLQHGRQGIGFKSLNTTDNNYLPKGKSRAENWRLGSVPAIFCPKQEQRPIKGGTRNYARR